MKLACYTHIKTLKFQRALNLSKWQAVGILESLFLLAAQNAPAGNIGKYANDEIALFMEYFGDPDELVSALIDSGYVDADDDERLVIHGWIEHRPKYLNDRAAKQRNRQNKDAPQTVGDSPRQSETFAPTIPSHTKPRQAKPNQTKIKPETENAGSPAVIARSVLDAWNKCPGVAQCRRVSKKRRAALNARLRESAWCEDYAAALAKFPLPCWADGSFKPNIDWFLREDTVNKILEENYDWTKNGKVISKPKKPKRPLTADEFKQRELEAEFQQLRQAGQGTSARGNELREEIYALEKQTR